MDVEIEIATFYRVALLQPTQGHQFLLHHSRYEFIFTHNFNFVH